MSSVSQESDVLGVIRALENAPFYSGQIVEHGIAERREPRYEEPERAMHESLLLTLGDFRLYTHQAAAFDLAASGHDVVVTTGTSSGKTYCYNLPVIDRLLKEPSARALYLFPTKALAQDQLGKLKALAPTGIRCATYDGDTPRQNRSSIRATSHIILTNPDMLHIGILPNPTAWLRFFKNLRYIVIDEMHTYSGVFGSHVALILSRLLRLCEWQGSKPQIIACSATIANGAQLFKDLTGRDGQLVDNDGAANGERHLLMWNPPPVDEFTRRSSNSETSQLFGSLVARHVRTLAFSKSRVAAELILRYTREGLGVVSNELPGRIESYRAGYTPEERRAIERKLFQGELLGLSSTDAMELGVDVGTLDAVVMNGYPGTISSLRQQAGRAGRGTRDGLAILVAKNDPLDQYYMRHAGLLLGGKAESVRVHPSNPFILAQQLQCAAYERPLSPTELEHFPPDSLEILEAMEEAGLVSRRSGMWHSTSQTGPAAGIDIRGSGGDSFTLEVPWGELGTMEKWRAFQTAHEGAIYLHRGEQFIVKTLNLGSRTASLEPTNANYYTQAISETNVESVAEIATGKLGRMDLHFQGLRVTTTVTAFKRKSLLDDSILGVEDLDLPPNTIQTVGVRIDLPADPDDPIWEDGVHALEHLLVALGPTIAQCEPRDLGSTYYAMWPETFKPAIFVFDAVPGGIGLSQALFEHAPEWFEAVREQLSSCPCTSGCPSCVLSPRCPYSNENVDKGGATDVLRRALP